MARGALRWALAAALVGVLVGPAAWAQEREAAGAVAARAEGPWTLLAIDDLARALGAPWSVDGDHLTLRADAGVLVVFAGSPDGYWQATGARDATPVGSGLPVARIDGRWFVPDDLLGVLGLRVDAGTLTLPGGARRALAFERPPEVGGLAEVVALGPGVEGLRLYAAAAEGPHEVSLLAIDLGLLGLAFPDQQVALDAVLRELRSEKALFLVVTALSEATWQPAIYVVQDGRETLLSAPLTVQVLEGDPERVGPGAPIAAVAFLPQDLDLRRPLTLRWAGVSGAWTLRR